MNSRTKDRLWAVVLVLFAVLAAKDCFGPRPAVERDPADPGCVEMIEPIGVTCW